MEKVTRSSSRTPLYLINLSDPKYLRNCLNGFGKGSARSAQKGELEALQCLVDKHCYKSSPSGYAEQVLWTYCLHVDLTLADFAIRSLSAIHAETAAFEKLPVGRRKNILRLLKGKLENEAEKRFLMLAESVANRALASEDQQELQIAVKLMEKVAEHRHELRLLSLESAEARKRRMLIISIKGERYMKRGLQVNLLHQLLVREEVEFLNIVEKSLAASFHVDGEYNHVYREAKEVERLFFLIRHHALEKDDRAYSLVMKWRVFQIENYLIDEREHVRLIAEKAVKNMLSDDLEAFLSKGHFDITIEQKDRIGRKIDFSLTRAQIHACLFHKTIEHVVFYHQFHDEELGRKAVIFLHNALKNGSIRSLSGEKPLDMLRVDQMVSDMATSFPLGVRRLLAQCRRILDHFFHYLLEPGLPLHSLDAIRHVDWQRYKELASEESIEQATQYVTRISRLNPAMHEFFNDKFGIQSEEKNS